MEKKLLKKFDVIVTSDNNCFNYFHYNDLITLLIGIQCDIQTYIHEVCYFCILQVVYLVHLQQYTRKKPGMYHIVYYVVYPGIQCIVS